MGTKNKKYPKIVSMLSNRSKRTKDFYQKGAIWVLKFAKGHQTGQKGTWSKRGQNWLKKWPNVTKKCALTKVSYGTKTYQNKH